MLRPMLRLLSMLLHGQVRLKVDYSGFSTVNTQRFGQQFVSKVANPHDMILWHKAPARRAKVSARSLGSCPARLRT